MSTSVRPQVTVVIDTTALVSDWFLESAAAKALLWAVTMLHVELVVPEIVVRETVNKWGERFDRALGAVGDLRRLSTDIEIKGVPESADAAKSDYEMRLRTLLEDNGLTVADFPSVSHEDVVARALARRKPFDDKGQRGYRDALIWHTLLEVLAAAEGRDVALITDNYTDFAGLPSGEGDGELMLVDSLAEEATACNDGCEVRVYRSIRGVVDAYVQPAAEIEEALNKRLTDDQMFLNGVNHLLGEAVSGTPDLLSSSFDDFLDVPVQHVAFDEFFGGVERVSVTDAWLLSDDEAVISLGGYGEASLIVQVRTEDLAALPEGFSGLILKQEELTSEVLVRMSVWVAFDGSYKVGTGAIEDLQFKYMSRS